jgi:hypothetical protein
MLTIITGPANSGRTALASWICLQLEEARSHTLIVSDERFCIERWLPPVFRQDILTPDEFSGQRPWPNQVPVLATFEAVVLDLAVLRPAEAAKVARLRQTDVYLVVQATRPSHGVAETRPNTTGGADVISDLYRSADRAYSLNRAPERLLLELIIQKGPEGPHQGVRLPLRFNIGNFHIEEA